MEGKSRNYFETERATSVLKSRSHEAPKTRSEQGRKAWHVGGAAGQEAAMACTRNKTRACPWLTPLGSPASDGGTAVVALPSQDGGQDQRKRTWIQAVQGVRYRRRSIQGGLCGQARQGVAVTDPSRVAFGRCWAPCLARAAHFPQDAESRCHQ